MEQDMEETQETVRTLAQIDQKIERLMSALAEGSDLTMPYINRTIEKLETQRGELLERQTKLHKTPRQTLGHLKFGPLTFEQKKLMAAQFIQKIELGGDTAKVIWKI